MKSSIASVLIVGAGPAGCTAAIYAGRANLSPIVVAGPQPGGQLMITTDVENYPGFRAPIQGPWLMEEMTQQAVACGASFVHDALHTLDLSQRPFKAFGNSGIYSANSVILAMGASAQWLGLDSETFFRGAGVSACAVCDGFFFKNKDVAVVGGGNTAVEEALFLTHHARSVTLIHRRDQLRADKTLQQRLFKNPKIRVLWNCTVTEVIGTTHPHKAVTGINVYNTQTHELQHLSMHGIFIAIGHLPNTQLVSQQLALDDHGYIIADSSSTRTQIPGVFAAGDVRDPIDRQAVTAAGQGCMAALDAERFLSSVDSE